MGCGEVTVAQLDLSVLDLAHIVLYRPAILLDGLHLIFIGLSRHGVLCGCFFVAREVYFRLLQERLISFKLSLILLQLGLIGSGSMSINGSPRWTICPSI